MLHQCGAAREEWWKAVFRKSSKAARGLPLVSLLRALWLLSQHDASTQRHKACTISHQMVRWHRPSTRALASDRALFFTSPGFGSLFVLSTQVQLSSRLNKQLRHPHCVPPKPDAHREPRRITSQMYCLLRASLCLSHTHEHTHTHSNLCLKMQPTRHFFWLIVQLSASAFKKWRENNFQLHILFHFLSCSRTRQSCNSVSRRK